jgi:hypothetical protein
MQPRHSRRIFAVLLVAFSSTVFFFEADANSQQTAQQLPTVQVAKLTASSGQSGTFCGTSVAMSGDTVVVGQPFTFVGNGAGAALVFVKPRRGWTNMTQAAVLVPSDGMYGDYFGGSVAIYGDVVVVGASQSSPSVEATGPGAAYVFVRPAGGWAGQQTETAKLIASDGIKGDALGAAVSIRGDSIVAGAPGSSPFTPSEGAAYVFVKPASGWMDATQTAKLTPSDAGVGDEFGYAVSIAGQSLVAGSPNNQGKGAAYIFVEPAGGWKDATQTAKLTASDGAKNDNLGYSISIADGAVATGAPFASVDSNQNEGAAYVFVEPAGGWKNMTQTAKLTEGDGEGGDLLGASVAISGSIIATGAAEYSRGPTLKLGGPAFWREGAVYLFSEPQGGWTTASSKIKVTGSDAKYDAYLGSSVDLSGTAIVSGSPILSYFTTYTGAAYVFERP